MSVYRQYDQAQLDAQYNLRNRHPDFQDHLDWWEGESDRVAHHYPCRPDVPYGDTPGQTLDAFPANQDGSPIHLFIHGGYWQGQDKSSFRYLAEPILEAGAAMVVINYDLAPKVGMDEIVTQARRAVAWCYQNAEHINGDPDRIHVSGHSAGGHLTAMMLSTDWSQASNTPGMPKDLPADLVKSGVAISGLFDLEPVRLCYLNEVLKMDDATARRNSPLHNLPQKGAPLVAMVGGAETEEFLRHNAEFAAAWKAKGFQVREMAPEGLNHYSIMRDLIHPESPLTRTLLAQMGL